MKGINYFVLCLWAVSSCWTVVFSQKISLCSLHEYDSTWEHALNDCHNRSKQLLCYKSEKAVKKILTMFFPPASVDQSLRYWISAKDCRNNTRPIRCLSMKIRRNTTGEWHEFQTSCEPKGFICCKIQQEVTPTTTPTTPITDFWSPFTDPCTQASDPLETAAETTTNSRIMTGKSSSSISTSLQSSISSSAQSSMTSSEPSSMTSSEPSSMTSSEPSSVTSSAPSSVTSSAQSSVTSSAQSSVMSSAQSSITSSQSPMLSSQSTILPTSRSSSSSSLSTPITTTGTKSITSTDFTKSSAANYSETTTGTIKPVCSSVKKRGIIWPTTAVDTTVVLPCPGNSSGNATWYCSEKGLWAPANPNMSECHSNDLKHIKENFDAQTSEETIDALKTLFDDDSESIQGSDLQDAMSMVSLLPEKLLRECESVNDSVRWERAEESVIKTTAIFSRMMDLDTWSDISQEEVPKVGSRILSAADNFVFFLADSMINRTHYSSTNNNIAVEVLKKKYGQAVSLPLDFGEHSQRGQISLHAGYNADLSPDKPISIIYIYYSNMSNILLANQTGSLNSPVVSTSVSQDGMRPTSISGQVQVLVEHLVAGQNDTTCVFWSFREHNWDPSGCRLKSSNSTHTLCECNHLTNFAVLMDYKGILVNEDDKAFFYITVIGCSISTVCLAFCITIFTFYRWQRKNTWGVRYSIHRNLCITLFLGNVLLIAGLNQTQNHVVCAVIAGFLHYLFLSAFSWMLLEGVHIYILLVIVFASKKTHWKKYYLFGYGFPLLVVGVTAAVRPDSYGTRNACWLAIDDGAVWSFTGPVAIILLLNSAALLLAQLKASKIQTKDDNVAIIKRWLRVTFILFPILGLTWVLGFLYVGNNYKVVAYIFAILNSLQGFCIFICHCLMDKRARSMVIDSIRKRISSVETETSGSNKRSKKEQKKGLINDKDGTTKSVTKKHCIPRWTPWTFHFTLNFTRKPQETRAMTETSHEEPQVLQWRKLQENATM